MRSRILNIIVIAVCLVGYISAERVLRAAQYKDIDIDEARRLMPDVIETPLVKIRELQEMEKEAAAEEDPLKKAKLLYTLADKSSGSKQRDAYSQIVKLVPEHPMTDRARIALASDVPSRAEIDAYLAFIDSVDWEKFPKARNRVWSTGYTNLAAKATKGPDRLHYLKRMAEVPILGSGMVEAYEDMEYLAHLHDIDSLELATTNLQICRERRMEQERRERMR